MIIKIITEIDRAKAISALTRLDIAKPYMMSLKRRMFKRSLPQNSLYWLWLSCISDETGNTSKELHEYFSSQYLPKKTVEVLGKNLEHTLSTTELNTKQFTDYLNLVEVDAASFGILLLHPDDRNFTEFYEHYFDKVG